MVIRYWAYHIEINISTTYITLTFDHLNWKSTDHLLFRGNHNTKCGNYQGQQMLSNWPGHNFLKRAKKIHGWTDRWILNAHLNFWFKNIIIFSLWIAFVQLIHFNKFYSFTCICGLERPYLQIQPNFSLNMCSVHTSSSVTSPCLSLILVAIVLDSFTISFA